MVVDREEIAWAAGLFEGEGYTGFTRTNHGARKINFTVTQQNREPLERFRKLFGVGRIYGPYGGPKQVSHFHCSSFEHAQAILAAMWPWLSTRRREQAKRTLRAYLAHPIKQHRKDT
jgi:hypothetical protein